MEHANKDRSTKASSLVNPTSLNLQPRPFAPLESEEKDEVVSRKSGYSENFLEKIINTPISESATPIQRKSGNRLKAITAERINSALQNQPIQRQEAVEEEKCEGQQEEGKQFTMNPEPPPVQRKFADRLRAKALQRNQIQAKLTIGEPNDKYEQEADATASRVVQQINSNASITSQSQPIQRQELEENEELQMKPIVQRLENMSGGEASTDLESSIQSARGSGRSLDANLQQSMGQAMGADFSGVKVHTDSQSDQLNKSIQAKAFTTGQDVFFRQGAYEPSSRGGQELIAHELTHVVQQNGGSQVINKASIDVIQRYDDIPTKTVWKVDSDIARTKRSDSLKSIDNELEVWDGLKVGSDKSAQIEQLYKIRTAINGWRDAKELKYLDKKGKGSTSERWDFIEELKAAVDQKLIDVQAAYRVDLAPLALEYQQAAQAHNMNLTRTKGTQLADADLEFFYTTTQTAMTHEKPNDMLAWACYYFGAPQKAFGGYSLTPMSLKMINDFTWLTKALADKIIDEFLVPFQTGGAGNQIVTILQHIPFRKAVEAQASKDKYQTLVDSMPLLRITSDVEGAIDNFLVDVTDIDQLAQTVFNAFLFDLPVSKLIYGTVTTTFSTVDYLLGNADAKVGAPCMVLSNIFNELFKMLMPNPPAVIQGGDARPLLTKPLASIGKRGILTRETAFKGNVNRYGDLQGYDAINRIFFGDGHIWLEINGKQYDPTLGIHGGPGTVQGAVEHFFVASGKNKYKKGNMVVTRTSAVPPGGQKLLFERSAEIREK
jgi:hypothetical protein